MSKERHTVIERDNLAYEIYSFLWKYEHYPTHYEFKVPNTIVFKNQEPIVWIFSNANNQVKKKTADLLTYDNIKRYFCSINNVSGIAATYMFQQEEKLIMKYLKSEEIGSYLDATQQRSTEGILQQFIDPNTHRNAVIKAVWSPSSCIMTKQINKQNIYNQQLDIYERACTFEGPPHLSEQNGNRLLKRLTCYFKLDEQENIYFLWSNSLRLEARANSQIIKSRSFIGRSFYNTNQSYKSPSQEKEIQVENKLRQSPIVQQIQSKFTIECYQCNSKRVKESFIKIPYKHLIEYQQYLDQQDVQEKHLNLPSTIEQYKSKSIKASKKYYNVPRVLQVLHPNLKYPTYASIKDSPQFFNRQAAVCSSCYFEVIGKATKASSQGVKIIKRSVSAGNSIIKRPYASTNEQLEQKCMQPIRLISVREGQRKIENEQYSSPQKFIEDDSECSKPTVFVKSVEKLSLGVQSLNGFQSVNNTTLIGQSLNATGTSTFNQNANIPVRQRSHYSSQSEISLQQHLKASKDLIQQQNLLRSAENSNGFVMKKTYSYYSSVEEGMDVPQKSQILQNPPFLNSELDKYSTIYSTSARQSWKDAHNSAKQEGEIDGNVKKVSIKEFVESQQSLLQSSQKQQQLQDQKFNPEDITLFNLIKPSNQNENNINNLSDQQQKSPEYSNTPTFQFGKGNSQSNLQKEVPNFKQLIEQKQLPYQYRLSFGNQTNSNVFQVQQQKRPSMFSDQKNEKIDNSSKKVSAILKEQQLQDKQKNEENDKDPKILINNTDIDQIKESPYPLNRKRSSLPKSEGYMTSSQQSESNNVQSEKVISEQKNSSRQSSTNMDIIQQLQIQQQKQSLKDLNKSPVQQQEEIETFQDSVIISEAENTQNKGKIIKLKVLKNNFTQKQVQQEHNQNVKSLVALPVHMQNNSNHLPIKKERAIFNVKKIESKSKQNEKQVQDKSEDGNDSDIILKV